MQLISGMSPATASNVRVVLCDLDDTLTTGGRLFGSAYQAVEDLSNAGISVAPITGRPAGWCDMIARFWPVQGVVGENGAFYYSYNEELRKMARRYHPALDRYRRDPARFDRIKARIENEVPGASISSDQPFRIADLAVDFREDVTPLNQREVDRIKEIFEEEGAVARISSIHVNGWFGDYDKLTMSRMFAADVLGIDIDESNPEFVFVGDSPNDAPMFDFFDNSCGVANVRAFTDRLPAVPKWISHNAGGEGFREIADHLLLARREG